MENTNTKVKAVSIWLNRAEGRHDECVALTVDGDDVWSKANVVLLRWSHTAPKTGGYNKCDFKVTYSDGSAYDGRYDLKHNTVEWPSLEKHVRDFLTFMAGQYCPPHMTEERYRAYLAAEHVAPHVEPSKQFLNAYEIGGR